MELQEVINETVKIIRSYLPESEWKIFLFGSWARGNAYPTSDVDIAILGTEKVKSETMSKILENVDNIRSLRSVDVIDLLSSNEQVRSQILHYAKPL